MKELEYPFDSDYILSHKKKIKSQLLCSSQKRTTKKIAILGGSTTNDIKLILELFLLNYGIEPSLYETEYNQFFQEGIFPSEKLKEFSPDIIYIHTSNRNIINYPCLDDTDEHILDMIDSEVQRFSMVWDNLTKTFNCTIIQNNFEMPFYRFLGNKDASDPHGAVNYISRLNQKFYEYAQHKENFYICDINYISADYGLKDWADPFYWYMYKYALNVKAIPYLAYNVANIIKSLLGKNKKGFVLDLDNTLWGGVVGDDGPDNIMIGPEESEGQAFLEFQEYIKKHKQLGIVLNINSKNDMENAINGLNNQSCILSTDDFVCIKANWNPKNVNFVEIANELNVAPDSLVFVDDNPAERHIISENIRGVSTPAIGEPYLYIQTLDRSGYFETTIISDDDKKRNDMYKENAKREQYKASFANYTDYLLSLNMKGIIKSFEQVFFSRIAQLTNKSNQFNLTTKRYTQTEIETISGDENFITLCGQLTDRFGDNGVVSIVIGHIVGTECLIDLWLMSCRVLKRDMEYAMMDTFVQKCKSRGVNSIKGYYYPTPKNGMVKDFYSLHGFIKINEDSNGNTEWLLNVESYQHKNYVIDVEE